MISEAKISSGVLDFVSLVVYWFPERFLLKQGLMLTVLSLFYRSPIDVVVRRVADMDRHSIFL